MANMFILTQLTFACPLLPVARLQSFKAIHANRKPLSADHSRRMVTSRVAAEPSDPPAGLGCPWVNSISILACAVPAKIKYGQSRSASQLCHPAPTIGFRWIHEDWGLGIIVV